MVTRRWLHRIAGVFFFLYAYAGLASAADLYFIDATSKADQNMKDLHRILQLMDANGVYRTLLSTNGQLADEAILALAEQYPGRIVPIVRLNRRGYQESRPASLRKLDKQVASGLYGGMGEALIYHAQKITRLHHASEIRMPMDDPRVKKHLAHAGSQGWPFIAHIEFHALSRAEQALHREALTRLLDGNRGLPVLLIHLGQLRADEAEPLLEAHPNLHMMASHCNPLTQRHFQTTHGENMFTGRLLSPAWTKLVLRFPDRFVFALDNVYTEHWDWYGDQMDYWRAALERLPPEVAHAFAHGNAERLWRLPPQPEAGTQLRGSDNFGGQVFKISVLPGAMKSFEHGRVLHCPRLASGVSAFDEVASGLSALPGDASGVSALARGCFGQLRDQRNFGCQAFQRTWQPVPAKAMRSGLAIIGPPNSAAGRRRSAPALR